MALMLPLNLPIFLNLHISCSLWWHSGFLLTYQQIPVHYSTSIVWSQLFPFAVRAYYETNHLRRAACCAYKSRVLVTCISFSRELFKMKRYILRQSWCTLFIAWAHWLIPCYISGNLRGPSLINCCWSLGIGSGLTEILGLMASQCHHGSISKRVSSYVVWSDCIKITHRDLQAWGMEMK